MKYQEHPTYETADFGLAVTLHALGATVFSIESKYGDRCVFIFEQNHDLITAVEAYWRKELHIEPQLLFATQRILKSRLNEIRYENNK